MDSERSRWQRVRSNRHELPVVRQENTGRRPEESQAEVFCVQNTTFQEFAILPFSKGHQQARESCTEILGRECKPIVARTVAPHLFAWPHGRRTSQLCPKSEVDSLRHPIISCHQHLPEFFFALEKLGFNEMCREKTPIFIGCVSPAWFMECVFLFG